MPLYEYACPSCNEEFERLRPMAEGASAECPQCHTAARRMLSMVAAPVRVGAGVGTMTMGQPSAGACACGGACSC